jgi:hypothetical protein
MAKINKLILGVLLGFGLGLLLPNTQSDVNGAKNKQIDTIFVYDTCVIYKDTCDSQFFKAIIETETRNYTRLRKGTPIKDSVMSSNGKYIGLFQMSNIYFKGCEIAQVLDYSYEQMFNPELSFHVFWAKMGVYAHRFRKQHKRLPSYEELARIHAGGYSNRFNQITDKYANYVNKLMTKEL